MQNRDEAADKHAFDYVIVGSGAAGCVLAYRLTADPSIKVALIEAGGRDSFPLLHVPKGIARAMRRVANLWTYTTEPEAGTGQKADPWVRGKVLGGSSSINGMMYVRGQPADFNSIAELSSSDWDWTHIGAAYQALERHELGAGETRGDSGQLRISLPGADVRKPLHEAMIQAGAAIGLPIKSDVNAPDDAEGIGYNPCTIFRGRRQSAAVAFLKPAMRRRNLSVMMHAVVSRIVFSGKRAVGVEFTRNGRTERVFAKREVILAGGTMESPAILERSGIGDPQLLSRLGIDLVQASPGVGQHLMEHRAILVQWKLKSGELSYNRTYSGWRLLRTGLRYLALKTGPLTTASFDIGAWVKSRPGLNRPDGQFLIAPHSVDFKRMGAAAERFPGMSMVIYPLRPSSLGSVHLRSSNPAEPPVLIPNYRATEQDRRAMIDVLRKARQYAEQSPLRELILAETTPGPNYQTDDEIIAAYDRFGMCGYHAVGSCRMGADAESVVDPELRVRGVDGLRVVDASIFPIMPSGNTNGPVMAMAWRAADVILRSPAYAGAVRPQLKSAALA